MAATWAGVVLASKNKKQLIQGVKLSKIENDGFLKNLTLSEFFETISLQNFSRNGFLQRHPV